MALHVSSFPLVASQGSRRGGERARHREQQDDQAWGMKTGANHGRALEVFVVLGVETSPFWRMYSEGDVPIQDTHFHLFEIWFLSFSPARLPFPSHTPLGTPHFFWGFLYGYLNSFTSGNWEIFLIQADDWRCRTTRPTHSGEFFSGDGVSKTHGIFRVSKIYGSDLAFCTGKCLFGSGFLALKLNPKNTLISEIYLEEIFCF